MKTITVTFDETTAQASVSYPGLNPGGAALVLAQVTATLISEQLQGGGGNGGALVKPAFGFPMKGLKS